MSLAFGGPAANFEVAPLTVELTSKSNVTRNDRDLIVEISIRNASQDEQVLQTYMCNYGDWDWSADNAAVHVQQPPKLPCKKNPLVYIKLKPGDTYKKALTVRISLLINGDTPHKITFRLGFQPRLGYNLPPKSTADIWSNSITVGIL